MKRIIALVGALAVPVLYIVAIILFATGNPNAELVLAVAIGVSLFIMPVIYLLTKFPKDMAEIYSNILEKIKKN